MSDIQKDLEYLAIIHSLYIPAIERWLQWQPVNIKIASKVQILQNIMYFDYSKHALWKISDQEISKINNFDIQLLTIGYLNRFARHNFYRNSLYDIPGCDGVNISNLITKYIYVGKISYNIFVCDDYKASWPHPNQLHPYIPDTWVYTPSSDVDEEEEDVIMCNHS